MDHQEQVFTKHDKDVLMNRLKSMDENMLTVKSWIKFWGIMGVIGAVAWLVFLIRGLQ